jgi:hypothetical protein
VNGVLPRRCLATAALMLGCATAGQPPAGGGRSRATVVAYRPVGAGAAPLCGHYALDRTGEGLAFVERSPLGSESAFPAHWIDATGDHFAVWDVVWNERGAPVPLRNGPAEEVWVPADRAQPAYLFVYRAGLYEVREVGGLKRPVPLIPIEARLKLEPQRGASP